MAEFANSEGRRRGDRDADIRHELAVIDRTLAGVGHETARDAELAGLVLSLRGERPDLPAEARDRLDTRFAERFREDREASHETKGAGSRLRHLIAAVKVRRRLTSAGAVALACALAATVVVSTADFGSRSESDAGSAESLRILSPDGGEGAVTPPDSFGRAVTTPGSTAPQSKAAAPGESDTVRSGDGSARRRVERSGHLTLADRADRVEALADRIVAVTDKFGGYVMSSSVTRADGTRTAAEFDLRLPADRHQRAMAEYSGLAHVRERSQESRDITASYDRVAAKLSAARAERDRLRTLLVKADDAQAPALRDRLRAAERLVAARTDAYNRMKNRVSYVTLGLTIVVDESAGLKSKGTIARALDTAADALAGFAAVLIVAAAVTLPLLLLIAPAVWIGRRVRRARGEAVIDDLADRHPTGPPRNDQAA